MVKKLLTLALGLVLGFGAMAQDPVDATIAFEDINYWVGEGTDSAVFIVNYGDPDTAFAWGYLFNGSTTAETMVAAIAADDPRFSVVGNPSVDGDLLFAIGVDDTLRLSPVDPNLGYNFWWTNLNGVSTALGAGATLQNGDVFKYGDLNSAIGWDYQYGYYMEEAWVKEPTPLFPVVYDATIAEENILYWVGEGTNKMRFVVNWADTSLAWGYKFSTETVSMTTVMDAIKAADSRFNYTMSGAYLGDITFNDGTVNLAITPGNWWEQKLNGVQGAGMNETIHNGDLNLWADPAAGVQVGVDTWGFPVNAYPMTIHPVSAPQTDAIREASAVSVSIYPNPASVRFNVVCGGLNNDTEAVLYDMTGRKVYSQTVNAGTTSISVETSNLANGVYMLHIGGNTSKVVVRH